MGLKELRAKLEAIDSQPAKAPEKTEARSEKKGFVKERVRKGAIAERELSPRVRNDSVGPNASGVEIVEPHKPLNPLKKIERAMVRLADVLTEDDLAEDVRVVREAKNAMSEFWDPSTKGWKAIPDHRMRLAAAAFSRSYAEGLPVARQIQLTADLGGMDDALEKLKGSPAAAAIIAALSGGAVAAPESGGETDV